jgi:hypothetical protein
MCMISDPPSPPAHSLFDDPNRTSLATVGRQRLHLFQQPCEVQCVCVCVCVCVYVKESVCDCLY